MAGVRVATDLVIDRYYRGAVVLLGDAMFALPEPAIRIIERLYNEANPSWSDDDRELVEFLVEKRLLLRSA
jgi:hypothetical protein